MYQEDGPSLSLGQQLCWREKSEVLCPLHTLHRPHELSQVKTYIKLPFDIWVKVNPFQFVSGHQPLYKLHSRGLEDLSRLLSPRHSGLHTLPPVRGQISPKHYNNNQTGVDRDKPRNLEFRLWVMDFGLLLWTEDDSGLPTGPLTITKTLKTFLW